MVTVVYPMNHENVDKKRQNVFWRRSKVVVRFIPPAVLLLLIVGILAAYDAYHFILLDRYWDVPWKVALCVLFIVVGTAIAGVIIWALVAVVTSSAGFVPHDPWKYAPICPQLTTDTNASVDVSLGTVVNMTSTSPVSEGVCHSAGPAAQCQTHSPVTSDEDKGGKHSDAVFTAPSTSSPLVRAPTPSPFTQGAVSVGARDRSTNSQREGSSATPSNPFTVSTLDRYGRLRYCDFCDQYKPDNAYHCRICGRCVYRLDHHCPLVNNCVGRNNYKIFVVFIGYGAVGCCTNGTLAFITFFVIDSNPLFSKLGWVAVLTFLMMLGLALTFFFGQHIYSISRGTSTLQAVIANRVKQQQREQSLRDCFRIKRRSQGPRPANEDAEVSEADKKQQIAHFKRCLFGTGQPWWRKVLPVPVRTDDDANDIL